MELKNRMHRKRIDVHCVKVLARESMPSQFIETKSFGMILKTSFRINNSEKTNNERKRKHSLSSSLFS